MDNSLDIERRLVGVEWVGEKWKVTGNMYGVSF